MRILHLARKDLMQIVRDRRSLIFMALMPLMFTIFFGITMGATPQKDADTRLKVGIIDQDGKAVLSQSLLEMLAGSDTVRSVEMKATDDLEKMVREGSLAAAITIPAGYSSGTLKGEAPVLDVVIDENSQAGLTARRSIQAVLTRLVVSAHMALVNADLYAKQAPFATEELRQAYLADSIKRSVNAWKSPTATVKMTGPILQNNAGGDQPANPYNQFSPGMMVMFAVFGLAQSALVLVMEKRSGALQRLLTTPMRRWEVIAGHILGVFTVVFLQQLILVLFGQFVLKVGYLNQPAGTLLMMAALSLWVSCLGLLIGAVAKVEEKVTLYSMIAMFLFSALGGSWFPLETAGKTFAAVGHLMPTAWAMDGFKNLVMRGLGFESVLLPAGILLGYSVLFFGAAVWRFKFE